MNLFNHLANKLRTWLKDFQGVFSVFSKDVAKKTYDEAVSATSKLIITIISALFLLLAGYTIYDRYNAWQDDVRNQVERQILGQVRDHFTNVPLVGVRVYVGGAEEETGTVTDQEGHFAIKFRINKNEEFINLNFVKEGYRSRTAYDIAVPLHPEVEDEIRDFTMVSAAYE